MLSVIFRWRPRNDSNSINTTLEMYKGEWYIIYCQEELINEHSELIYLNYSLFTIHYTFDLLRKSHGGIKMKNKTRKTFAKVVAILIATAMILSIIGMSVGSAVFAAETNQDDYLKEEVELLRKLMIYVENNYVTDLDGQDLVKGAYAGVFDSLDKYSNFFPENKDYENFVESVSGEYVGIGIILSAQSGQIVVISPMSDSPAYEEGMQTNDIIVEVDGNDVSDLGPEIVVNMIRGEEGTSVNVGVKRQGVNEIIKFDITRKTIKIDSVLSEVKEETVGYIKIVSFDSDTGKEFKARLAELREQNVSSLVIDLRNNGGGYISSAVEVAEQIIPIGPVTYLESQGETLETYYSKTPQIDIPVAVLINGGSASASEILAGAIQDTESGVLVGTQSFGKGSAQETINLQGVGGMKLTVAHFLSPNKNMIHEIGLTPNIIVENRPIAEMDAMLDEVNNYAPMIEETKPQINDVGLNVYAAQQRLSFLGYHRVQPTGTFDMETYFAVKQLQSTNDLYPYGVLDYTTQKLINQKILETINNTTKDPQLQEAIDYLKK